MVLGCGFREIVHLKAPSGLKIRGCSSVNERNASPSIVPVKKRCLRCNTLYQDKDNSPTACLFHGHTTGVDLVERHLKASSLKSRPSSSNGEKGLFALAPPHQGIDGEWTDGSGVIVYKWNEKGNRPNTGNANWKKRWSCCQEYSENAPPCRQGWHVCYDDGYTLY